jgi:hypothetical protein
LNFANTDPRFQRELTDLAHRFCKPVVVVYESWREYSGLCDLGDQSAILPEFERWYKNRLTAPDLLAIARRDRPNVRYAIAWDGAAVGGWDEDLGRFVPVMMRATTGEWLHCNYEVLIDGNPAYKPEDWRE